MSALEILNLEDIGGSKKERGIQFRILECTYLHHGVVEYIPQWNGDPDDYVAWIDISTKFNTLQKALDAINSFRNNRPFMIKEVYKSY